MVSDLHAGLHEFMTAELSAPSTESAPTATKQPDTQTVVAVDIQPTLKTSQAQEMADFLASADIEAPALAESSEPIAPPSEAPQAQPVVTQPKPSERVQALKDKVAQERAKRTQETEIARAQQELAQTKAELARFRQLEQRLKAEPFAVLRENGVTEEHITGHYLQRLEENEIKAPPAIVKKLQDLEATVNHVTTQLREKDSQIVQSAERAYVDEIAAAAKQHELAYLEAYAGDGLDLAYRISVAHFNETKQILPADVAAAWANEELEADYNKRTPKKKTQPTQPSNRPAAKTINRQEQEAIEEDSSAAKAQTNTEMKRKSGHLAEVEEMTAFLKDITQK